MKCILCAGTYDNYLKMEHDKGHKDEDDDVISDASPRAQATAHGGDTPTKAARPKERSHTPEKERRPQATMVDNKSADTSLDEM